MKRSRKFIIFGLITALALAAGIMARNFYIARSARTARMGISRIASVKVTRGDLKVTVSGNGKVEFSEKKEATSKIDGKVSSVNVKDGDQVKKGDVLAAIDISDAVAAKENEIRLMENKVKLQEIAVKEQDNNLEDLRQTKNNSVIAASYTGILSELSVRPGDNVTNGQRIGMIGDTSRLHLILPFDKEKVIKVQPGQKVDVYLTDNIDNDIKSQGEILSISDSYNEGQAIANVEVILEGNDRYVAGANAFFSLEVDGTTVEPIATGKLEWTDTYTLISAGNGKVKEILKEPGEKVFKGDAILRLENKNIDLDIEKAQYNKESAQIELDRLKKQLEQLKEDLETMKADSRILSPIDGIISNLAIEVGSQIKTGTVTAVISNSNELVIPVRIDELDISKVKVGQTAEITLDALEDRLFSGTVDKVAVEGTNENGIGSFEVVIRISDPENIKPGMSANVEILVSEKTNTLILPIEAVQKSDGEYIVYRKPDNEAAEGRQGTIYGRQNIVPVKLGLVSDSYVEIVEGLSEGDEVLITGQEETTTNIMMPGIGRQQRFQRSAGGFQARDFTPPNRH